MFNISRRTFVAASSLAVVTPAVKIRASSMIRRMDGGLPASFPTQDPDLVREVVLKSHTDYDGVNALVSTRPELAKAAWDWGFGDWESALGAASHMGRRDMAELLIAHGARPNLFTFTMLGQVDVVRAVCTANPGIQGMPGPHGITLMRHAVQGGDDAKSVVEYLDELGDADVGVTNLPLDAKAAEAYVGEYVPDGAPDVVFHIEFQPRREGLTFMRDDRQLRFLMHQGNHVFNPGGAASVKIEFAMADGSAKGLSIADGDLAITARRSVAP